MQTFLVYPLFGSALDCLDNKRLGKQRVEAKQIYDIITGKSKSAAWRNHPAVLMWKGYEKALALYYNMSLHQWQKRGHKNIKLKEIKMTTDEIISTEYPPWLGEEKFHASHRSNLKRKNPEFYGKYDWEEPLDLPYVWPTKEGLM
jgi:hypothetical protein